MKKIIGFLFVFLTLPAVHAEDAGNAIVAILDATSRQFLDSTQFEIGAGLGASDESDASEWHFGLNYFMAGRYKLGIAAFFPTESKNTLDDYSLGVTLGRKNYHPKTGRHYLNLSVGSSRLNNTEGVYLEPSITFRLSETSPVKYFVLMNSFGLNASIAFRHVFIQKKSVGDTNAVFVRLDLFMRNRLLK